MIRLKERMKKRILVTGGAGFIGAHLCKRLLAEGDYVICLDNFLTGNRSSVVPLEKDPDFELVEHDVTVPYDTPVDEIYNLACPASPIHYQRDPIRTLKTSVLGAINMLELARTYHAKVMQASTSEVYGDPLEHPQNERYFGNVNPIGPRSCYDEGKRCAETLFFDYHSQLGVRIKVIRIFNTYGPLMQPNDGRVVSNFILQALKGEDITIYGDGAQTRSFQYIDNLIEGMVRMMAQDDSFIGPVNLGNPKEFTILQLAQNVIRLTGSSSKLVFLPCPADDPRQRSPDVSLSREKLDYVTDIELEEGLVKTIEYFKNEVLA